VTVITDAGSALSQLRGLAEFDLILCDLMMPITTGMDVFATLKAEQPALLARLSFMTGGAFTTAARAFVEEHKDRVIDKPLDPHRLAELLSRAMKTNKPLQA
jgi:CheY-like chemotaxis protein